MGFLLFWGGKLTSSWRGIPPLPLRIFGMSGSASGERHKGRQISSTKELSPVLEAEGVASRLMIKEIGEAALRERRAPARERNWNFILAVVEGSAKKMFESNVVAGSTDQRMVVRRYWQRLGGDTYTFGFTYFRALGGTT